MARHRKSTFNIGQARSLNSYQPDRYINVPRPSAARWTTPSLVQTQLYPRSDLRRYNPTVTISAPAAKNINATRLVAKDTFGEKIRRGVPKRVAFTAPNQVAICVRRKMRKQVLHALKKTGKHGRKHTRRNQWSSVSC